MSWIIAHQVEVAGILFGVSELLGLGNKGGILKMIYDGLKSWAGK